MNSNKISFQNLIQRIKNNPIVAFLILFGTIIIALASFTDATKNLLSLISKQNPEEARMEINKLGLEFTPEVFIKSAKNNDEKAIKLFLVAGMDPDLTNKNGNSALMHAVKNSNTEIINILIEAKVDINKHSGALSWAVGGDIDILNYLLNSGSDTNSINNAFVSAAYYGELEILRILKNYGAELDKVGEKALQRVLTSNIGTGEKKNQTIKFLLNYGVDVNTKFDEGWTPLLYSAFYIDSENRRTLVLKTLLNSGAEVNAQCVCKHFSNGGFSALMLVARDGSRDDIQALLDKGAEIDLKNSNGQTALILAAQYRNEECVRTLLAHKASTSIKDIDGKTALDYAKEGNIAKIVTLLDKFDIK